MFYNSWQASVAAGRREKEYSGTIIPSARGAPLPCCAPFLAPCLVCLCCICRALASHAALGAPALHLRGWPRIAPASRSRRLAFRAAPRRRARSGRPQVPAPQNGADARQYRPAGAAQTSPSCCAGCWCSTACTAGAVPTTSARTATAQWRRCWAWWLRTTASGRLSWCSWWSLQFAMPSPRWRCVHPSSVPPAALRAVRASPGLSGCTSVQTGWHEVVGLDVEINPAPDAAQVEVREQERLRLK